MSEAFTFTIDGQEIQALPGQTILQAADQAGVYIPRLCFMKGLLPRGACRVCTVTVNGRPQAASVQLALKDAVVENNTDKLNAHRRAIIDMLFVEGNHYCMFCEKSGNCELQALAYRLGIAAPQYPYMFPNRELDASHPDILVERNRCIMCGRCVNASRDVDGKRVYEFVGRGIGKRIAVNAESGLGATDAATADKAAEVCPVGALIKKRVGYAVPVGQRKYDHEPIGSEIEKAGAVRAGQS